LNDVRSIYAVVGATAAGKTALALELAERIGAEIVSCDSMQLYRELDIGTAKPSAGERARVRHHLIDLLAPDEGYSAARYCEDADRAIADIQARGRRVLLVGGAGLYLRALRFGLFAAPPRDSRLRAQLYALEETHPGSLHTRLRAQDPETATRLPAHDLVRIVRALEVHTLTSIPFSQHRAAHRPVARHPIEVLVLDPSLADLMTRITVRVDAMLATGLVEETRQLRQRWGVHLATLRAVGYRQVGQFLDGELGAAELAPAIVRATYRYARRQRVWFKKEPGARWFASAAALHHAIEAGDASACRQEDLS
jgi:tRNA dimethylallyltransferase